MDRKKKSKLLLMGKSGSGKSSMRSIIFANYVAKDTRRLGATIDVEHSHVKFMGSLTLNIWDCGGQDAFMETYLVSQRANIFSDVGVLIYVFDIESREFDRDMVTYTAVISALGEYSPRAQVFCLIHKMDLVLPDHRHDLFAERSSLIQSNSVPFTVSTYATSIWDQTLYKAWASIVYTLIPNLAIIERMLSLLLRTVKAHEVALFERSTFLMVTCVTSPRGERNPNRDRFERISNMIKTFKHSIAKHTGASQAQAAPMEMTIKTPKFNLILAQLTKNTFIMVVLEPGEALVNVAMLNVLGLREEFLKMDLTAERDPETETEAEDMGGNYKGKGKERAQAGRGGEFYAEEESQYSG
ncbi:MAG: GTP-binding protein gtr1 [Cirrosporium novae-zelandiae]|nr:MAG: GTP-binding protein gtr1 [Cirrosporium novae-zelandiae]